MDERHREHQRKLNAAIIPYTLRRFDRGVDSIERLRARATKIAADPNRDEDQRWTAQNFLEQVEAALEAKE